MISAPECSPPTRIIAPGGESTRRLLDCREICSCVSQRVALGDESRACEWRGSLRILGWILLILAAIASWGAVWALIVPYDIGSVADFAAPQRILAYAVFILAPLLTFAPIGRVLRIPLYDLEAVVGWSTLIFVVTFFNPGDQPPLTMLMVFLLSLLMSLATIFTLISYAVGYRILTRRSQKYDFLRARREGYLISMFLVGMLLLHLLEVLTIVNGALMALMVVLLEIFLLSRGSPEPASSPDEVSRQHAGIH